LGIHSNASLAWHDFEFKFTNFEIVSVFAHNSELLNSLNVGNDLAILNSVTTLVVQEMKQEPILSMVAISAVLRFRVINVTIAIEKIAQRIFRVAHYSVVIVLFILRNIQVIHTFGWAVRVPLFPSFVVIET